jgi:predicted hotdog family 3-hydroxylacyl-ACP dehydratase
VNAVLDRAWIAAHLPHQGAMNLLDAVIEWNNVSLRAVAANHHAKDHPMRRGGELPIVAGIEYGAQAAAAHGAAASQTPSGAGMIASVRSVHFHARRLDDVPGNLDIRVEQLGGSSSGVVYRFDVSSGGRSLVEGRVTVAFVR